MDPQVPLPELALDQSDARNCAVVRATRTNVAAACPGPRAFNSSG